MKQVSRATRNRHRKRGLYQDDIYPPRIHVTIAVSELLYAGLQAIAAAERWTISRAANEVLTDYFNMRGEP